MTLKIKVFIRTDKVGSKCEDSFTIDNDEWQQMGEEEQQKMCREVAFNMGEWGYDVE